MICKGGNARELNGYVFADEEHAPVLGHVPAAVDGSAVNVGTTLARFFTEGAVERPPNSFDA